MNILDLKAKAEKIIDDIKNNGVYLKENTLIDYKLELKLSPEANEIVIFLRNFAKDILAFANKNGGILFLGFNEDKATGTITDDGLKEDNIVILQKIDLKNLCDQFTKIFDLQINVDIQMFNIAARRFYYVLIEKHNSVLIPKNDYPEYDLKKGDVIYRGAGNNLKANGKTSEFNTFIETKVNEKNQEFMRIWSSLFPEIFDINPREILIINPLLGRVYGYNSKSNSLMSADLDIDNSPEGPINVVLNAISAGEIGKISTDEGKPIYKLIGEIVVKKDRPRESTSMTTIHAEIKDKCDYKISNIQLKQVMHHLKWVNNPAFNIGKPESDDINPEFSEFIWIESTDDLKNTKKVFFSPNAVNELLPTVNNVDSQIEIYGTPLKKKE